MLALSFTFPGGHYHATPWGRHVNEADVEWPPSPWRIMRSLIAVWHRKGEAIHRDEDRLSRLLGKLASESPNYRVPEGVHAHTRHYMPAREGKSDRNTLIFDAFARIAADEPLVIIWPTVELTDDEASLLDELLTGLGFLGRAESWVEASRLSIWDGECNCVPGDSEIDAETGEVREQITLLAALPPARYAEFQQAQLEGLAKRSDVRPKGKKAIDHTLPSSWLAAVSLDTSELRAAGWNTAPAARPLTYLRPAGLLRPTGRVIRRAYGPSPATTARFALYGKPLPRIEDAVRVGEWLRLAVVGKAGRLLGEDKVPAVLSGHDLPVGSRHGHAFYLPEDADGDGFIDHVIVHAPGGLDAPSRRVLGALTRLWTRDGLEWQLILEGVAADEQLGSSSRLLESGQEWRSVTPYLHPWHVKKRFRVEDQIRRECRERGLPEPAELEAVAEVEVSPGQCRRPIHFHRFRSKRGLIQPDRQGGFWRLTFPEAMRGPLALGFGCHFGLGLFQPEPG
jgi:CRISPR-associated protein Csb2